MILNAMYCCLQRWSKPKKATKDESNVSGDRMQILESESRLPLQANFSSESGVGNPRVAVSTAAELESMPHRSADSTEPRVVSSCKTILPVAKHRALQLASAISSGPVFDRLDEAAPADGKQSRDLWEAAFAELDDEERRLLAKIEKSQGPSIVDKVLDQTKERYREHEERGWSIPRGKGKGDTNLRPTARKIMSSILSSKDLIDHVVAFDPTGYASTAWAIVSFGLQMVKNNKDRLESVFEACGTLSETLPLCAAIDASYRDQNLPDNRHLEEAIIGIYVAILKFSAEIVNENTMRSGQKMLNSIYALEEQPLQNFINTLETKKRNLSQWTSIIQHQYSKHEKEEIDKKVDKILDGVMEDVREKVSSLKSRALIDEEDRILNWFSEYPFSESQRDASSRRDAGTAAWILESPEYKVWKASGDKVLWLYGNCKHSSTSLRR